MARKKAQKTGREAQRRRVLQGHRQYGKRFIPPFLDYLNSSEIGWLDDLLPELIWIGLMNAAFGIKRGVELSVELAKAASACTTGAQGAYVFVSEYDQLQPAEQECVRGHLSDSGALDHVTSALRVLAAHYPECPLAFLWSTKQYDAQDETALSKLRELILALADRREKAATWVQATAVYMCFLNDKLKVFRGSALADFTAIEAYPDTDESMKVASSVRASITGFLPSLNLSNDWRHYFWNRGLRLQPCEGIENDGG
jgi:hypothetical protein